MYKLYVIIILFLFSFETYASQKKCAFQINSTQLEISKSELTNKYKCKQGDRVYILLRDPNGLVETYLNNFAWHNCDYNSQILISFGEDSGNVSCILKLLDRRN